jgi:hypothetical protein
MRRLFRANIWSVKANRVFPTSAGRQAPFSLARSRRA